MMDRMNSIIDELDHIRKGAIAEWERNEEAKKQFQTELRTFIETKPLYSQSKIKLPPGRIQFYLDVARLYCENCKTEQPFRRPPYEYWYHFNDKNLRFSEKQILREGDLLMNGIFPIELECQECKSQRKYFFVYISVTNGLIMKFGQYPMWKPRIDKEIRDELGPSAMFYEKALRNLNESYGIGACAYFRRMLESYINPLLNLLHDFKKEEGADDTELQKIKEVIASKNFTTKTEYAAQICPPALIVGGMNPLKELHDLLSYNIHAGSDEAATNIAIKIRTTIEYVIRTLRKHYEAQKQFIDSMKQMRNEKNTADHNES